MNNKKIKRFLPLKSRFSYFTFCFVLLVFLLVSIILSIFIGSVNIKGDWIFKIISNNILNQDYFHVVWPKASESIVWNIRLPRVLLSVLVGSGLSLSGIAMQALTKNSLADPYILGISSGASSGAVATIMFGCFSFLSSYSTMIGAFIGAVTAIILTFKFSCIRGRITSTQLVLSGIAVSALFSALTNLMIFKENSSDKIRTALFWMTGSLGGTRWSYIGYVGVLFIICTILLLVLHKALDALLLGDATAITLGVNIRVLKIIIIILCTLLTGSIVSVSGVIGFVGLIIPHITRTFVGSSHRRLMPASILLGALFLIWSDVFARVIVSPEELPIGVVTAFIGAPFFLWLLRKSSYTFGGSR
ncbi:FecCD family ABC transporter permease [Clostridium weizhouense]|uniref:Iron ABC transporter permease n=1 Tax=Clostridium weizhouense TaxID=2859781 RepID=A0ABS7ASU8_9CLOT|nr:iron ABC transporter permease [Clostridium weizhouense]MBW6411734.1 iron ABC transporter permease [Clostridium weizhouense]